MSRAASLSLLLLLPGLARSDPVPLSWRDPVGPTAPWGMHLAYAPSGDGMVVMWTTRSHVAASNCAVAPLSGGAALHFTGEESPFSDVGNVKTLHRVHMSGLAAGARFNYSCGDAQGEMSPTYTFTTQPQGAWSPRIAIYGDMGVSKNAQQTMPWLLQDAADSSLDVIFHIGDAAYNLDSSAGLTGDAFMTQIAPLASTSPYMICPGNHESATDFYEYRMLLGAAMPSAASPSAGGNGTFWSLDIGLVHLIAVSSEVYFSNQPHSSGLAAEQATWLAADLASVDRAKTPWVVMGLHQPFYCSANDDSDDCHLSNSAVRGGLEHIIYEGGVDLVYGAHEHAYERNYPVYESKWSGVTGAGAYVNADRPIHILSGAAGCPENQDPWQPARKANAWSAIRVNDFGYGILHAVNATTLTWLYKDNLKGAVLDEVTVVKTKQNFP